MFASADVPNVCASPTIVTPLPVTEILADVIVCGALSLYNLPNNPVLFPSKDIVSPTFA